MPQNDDTAIREWVARNNEQNFIRERLDLLQTPGRDLELAVINAEHHRLRWLRFCGREDQRLWHDAILKAAEIITAARADAAARTDAKEQKHGLDSAVTAESVTAKVAEGPADLGPASVPDVAGVE